MALGVDHAEGLGDRVVGKGMDGDVLSTEVADDKVKFFLAKRDTKILNNEKNKKSLKKFTHYFFNKKCGTAPGS